MSSNAAIYAAPQIWESTLAQLHLRITRQNYDTWLRNTIGLRFEATTLIVGAPNDLARDWLATRMRSVITQALSAVAGPGLSVGFEVLCAPAGDSDAPLQPSLLPAQTPPLNPRFTFSSFVSSTFNELACSAALAVAEEEQSCYSPLFITGGSGNGKTHLLHAIAHQAAARRQQPMLVSADQFLSEFTNAVRDRAGAAFRARYRKVDLLLVDDVQLLLGKKATIAEFYQTVSGLHDEGRRVVVAGDLAAMNGEGTRFRSELRWGLVATIEPATTAERVAFVQMKAAAQGMAFPPEVQHYIALRVRSSIRELEGAVNRVAALARISKDPITIDFAGRALRPVGTAIANHPQVQPTQLIDSVCRHLGLDPQDISSARRERALTYARHIAMYLLRHDADLTYVAIARLLGKKDHSTVVHACNQIDNEMPSSPTLRADIDTIRTSLRNPAEAA